MFNPSDMLAWKVAASFSSIKHKCEYNPIRQKKLRTKFSIIVAKSNPTNENGVEVVMSSIYSGVTKIIFFFLGQNSGKINF